MIYGLLCKKKYWNIKGIKSKNIQKIIKKWKYKGNLID